MPPETAIGGEAREFPPTRWTLILSSREETDRRRDALHELIGLYWKPLYFFARRKGLNIEEAKDAVQDFVARLLEKDFLARLDPAKGRFRSYLRTAFANHLANLHESRSAQKRGGGAKPVSLDIEIAEGEVGAAPAGPDAAFERAWAVEVMERALSRLRGEFDRGDRAGPLDLFLRYFREGAPPSYAKASTERKMSIPQIKAFLHRTRVRFREIVREEVAPTVEDPGEVDVEIGELLDALAGRKS